MALLVSLTDTDIKPWLRVFRDGLGDFDIRIYPDVGNVGEIEYVAAWKHPFGEYIKYPNLKAILSLGAGVDHIINDPELPQGVPIVRMEDNALTQDMCLYALHWTLHFHSDYFRYAKQQQGNQWMPQPFVSPSQRNIGVMGFGAIGREVANSLASQGFCVSAWGSSKKNNTGDINYYSGGDQLSNFIAAVDILINVLPLTPSTRNMVDEEVLKQLPKGAFVVNMARGGIINEADLLKLLNEGHITAAALDVFEVEPLPETNSLWTHPSVYLTPHIAGQSDAETSALMMVENIRRMESGKTPFPLYDPNKGY
jgi:glyoxylate/hydroxypyruvate reductase A